MAYVDHPVGHLAHAEPGRLTQLLLLVLAGVWMVRVAMEPILEIIGHRLGEFSPFPFRPLGHGGSGGRKGGNGTRGGRLLGAIGERVGLGVVRESPGVKLLLRLGGRVAVGLWVGARTRRSRP